MRAFEAWLAAAAGEVHVPCGAWTGAHIATPAQPDTDPVVVVLVGLRRRALWALGLLHAWAWWRVAQRLGRRQNGYRVLVAVTAR